MTSLSPTDINDERGENENDRRREGRDQTSHGGFARGFIKEVKTIGEGQDAILKGLDNLDRKVDNGFEEVNHRNDKVESGLREVKFELKTVSNAVKDLSEDVKEHDRKLASQ